MVILGLGSNLGNREEHLRHAVALLNELLANMHCSAVYESQASLPRDAPAKWDMPFLNMAVRGDTQLKPYALLAQTQALERTLGRSKIGHWGPREIDIDILAYDDYIVADTELAIPHRELLVRDFALIPLANIAPDWIHPQMKGKTARELAAHMAYTLKKTNIVIK